MRESTCLFLVSTGFEHLDSHLIVRVGNSTTNEKSVKFSFLPFLELRSGEPKLRHVWKAVAPLLDIVA